MQIKSTTMCMTWGAYDFTFSVCLHFTIMGLPAVANFSSKYAHVEAVQLSISVSRTFSCTCMVPPVGFRTNTARGQPPTEEGRSPRHTLSATEGRSNADSLLSPAYTVHLEETSLPAFLRFSLIARIELGFHSHACTWEAFPCKRKGIV